MIPKQIAVIRKQVEAGGPISANGTMPSTPSRPFTTSNAGSKRKSVDGALPSGSKAPITPSKRPAPIYNGNSDSSKKQKVSAKSRLKTGKKGKFDDDDSDAPALSSESDAKESETDSDPDAPLAKASNTIEKRSLPTRRSKSLSKSYVAEDDSDGVVDAGARDTDSHDDSEFDPAAASEEARKKGREALSTILKSRTTATNGDAHVEAKTNAGETTETIDAASANGQDDNVGEDEGARGDSDKESMSTKRFSFVSARSEFEE